VPTFGVAAALLPVLGWWFARELRLRLAASTADGRIKA
jgi:hypothetical protein